MTSQPPLSPLPSPANFEEFCKQDPAQAADLMRSLLLKLQKRFFGGPAAHNATRMRNGTTASERVGETMLNLQRKAKKPIGNVRSYARRSAINETIDAHRRAAVVTKHLGTLTSLDDVDEAKLVTQALEEVADERLEHLAKAIDKLKKEAQLILYYHYFEGIKLKVIAEYLGVKLDTVQKQHRRLLKRLKACILRAMMR